MNPVRHAYFARNGLDLETLTVVFLNGHIEYIVRRPEPHVVRDVRSVVIEGLGDFIISVYWSGHSVFCSSNTATYAVQVVRPETAENVISGIARGTQQGSLLREFQSRPKTKRSLPGWF